MLHDLNFGSFQEGHRIFVHTVSFPIHDAIDASVDKRLGAVDTGQVGDIANRIARRYAVQCSLDDSICFGMNSADTMSIHHEMTNFVAVVLSGG